MTPKAKRDDPKQSQRFIDAARELKTDKSGKAFAKAFKKIAPAKHPAKRK